MRLREQTYAWGLLRQWEPEVPCISVGNISWGGTGKTPVCGWVLDWACRQGLRSVLLTRGYKSRPPRLPFWVRPDSSVLHAGDEPLLLAQNSPRARVVVDPKRIRSGPWAMREFSPDMFVLDDGFQHLAVKRHFNLVLLSPRDIEQGWNKVLPAGTWREDKQALFRADAFLLNTFGRDINALLPAISSRLLPLNKPLFAFQVEASGLRQTGQGDVTLLPDAPYVLVTAIANPQKVLVTCEKLMGQKPLAHLVFADHHAFSQKDADNIASVAKQKQARIVCTQKDAVKLAAFSLSDLYTLDVRVRFISPSGMASFPDWFSQKWEQMSAAIR